MLSNNIYCECLALFFAMPNIVINILLPMTCRNRRGRDRLVFGFTTTHAISSYHLYSCEFEPYSWRGVFGPTSCDEVCQWLTTGQCFSLGTPISSTNKTDCHDIAEILLKVVLNTINLNLIQWHVMTWMGSQNPIAFMFGT